MGNQASSASRMLNLWKRDVTPDRSSAHHGRGGTVGGGGNCAVDTGVSKQSNVRRKETMVDSSEVIVGHSGASNVGPKRGVIELELCSERRHVSVAPVTLGHSGAYTWGQEEATNTFRRKYVEGTAGYATTFDVGLKRSKTKLKLKPTKTSGSILR